MYDPDIIRFIASYMCTDDLLIVMEFILTLGRGIEYIGTFLILLNFYKKKKNENLSNRELMIVRLLSRLDIKDDYFGEILLAVEDIQQKIRKREFMTLRYIQHNVAHQKQDLYDSNITRMLLSYFPQF